MIAIGKADINGFLHEHKTVKVLTHELIDAGWIANPNPHFVKNKLVDGVWKEGADSIEITDKIQELKNQKIEELKQSACDKINNKWDLLRDNIEAKSGRQPSIGIPQFVLDKGNTVIDRFDTMEAEINTLTTIQEINDYIISFD